MANPSLANASQNLSTFFKSVGKETNGFDRNLVKNSRRVMRLLAAPLVMQMGITADRKTPVKMLDSACGSGVFTQEVQDTLTGDVLKESLFSCADSSEGLVELVRKRVVDEGWVNTETKVLDAMDTGLPESSFSHVGVTLGLHLIPDPDAVVKDAIRILQPGGIFGATTFPSSNSNSFWYPDMRSAFASFPFPAPFPESVPMQMHESGRWYDTPWVEQHLTTELGLKEVQVVERAGEHRVEGAEEFVSSFGMMLPWMMSTWWSEETRTEHPVEEVRELVRKHLEEKYGGEGWAIRWKIMSMTGVVDK